MNKQKWIIIGAVALTVIVGILLIVSFINSGGDNNSNNDNNDDDNNNNNSAVVLEYWGLWESEEVMQPLIDEYQDENPNVTIKYTQKSFTQYEENVYTRIEQGSIEGTPAPDIFRMNNTWLPKFQKYLSPVPEAVYSSAEYSDTFYPTAKADLTGTNQNLYAIPLEIDGLALFYNKEILASAGVDAPPTDWDSLIELSKELTVRDGSGQITQAGISMGSADNVVHSADILSLLMLQNGAEINQNFNTEVDLDSDRAVSAMNFYVDFLAEHQTWSADLPNDLEMFYSGKLAMMFGPSWRAFDILNANPRLEFGIATTPIIVDEELYYSMYWAEAVSAKSDNQAEAWKFIGWLSEQAQLKKFYSNSSEVRAFGEPYSRESMGSELADQPYVAAIIEMAPNMTAWKMGEQTYIEQRLRDAITDVAENNVQAEQALFEAEEDINERLADLFATEEES
ncbi:MAG: sugar ABC transporter substrate-binding protein [Candidatus Dojkabacteria bacterium]|nr:MAG: sugar ABC transporter substrate-binding protein [Candidatus Dojkabacteria bacterium]